MHARTAHDELRNEKTQQESLYLQNEFLSKAQSRFSELVLQNACVVLTSSGVLRKSVLCSPRSMEILLEMPEFGFFDEASPPNKNKDRIWKEILVSFEELCTEAITLRKHERMTSNKFKAYHDCFLCY